MFLNTSPVEGSGKDELLESITVELKSKYTEKNQ